MTQQTKHTEGPWEAVIPDNGAIIIRSMSKTTARKLGLKASEALRPHTLVCKVANILWNRSERIANAHLIAAAPELLEALKIADAQLRDLRDSIYSEGKEKVRAAIAKATGAV